MIRSMTGFGRAESAGVERRFIVEIKAVNNRYLDISVRMPRKLGVLEANVRGILKETIGRGKVDVFITLEEYADRAGALRYNGAMAEAYVRHARNMAEKFGLAGEVSVSDIMRAPEVFSVSEAEADTDELWKELEPTLREAVGHFNEAREAEGGRLRQDMLEKLNTLEKEAREVQAHEPEILAAYKAKLGETLAEILADRSIDDSRIAAECVVYADKICTDEETVRLLSHIRQMRDDLEKGGVIGRKLDFLAQEMNREANTTLSKAGDIVTADLGISLKTLIEKLREQIQNIE